MLCLILAVEKSASRGLSGICSLTLAQTGCLEAASGPTMLPVGQVDYLELEGEGPLLHVLQPPVRDVRQAPVIKNTE